MSLRALAAAESASWEVNIDHQLRSGWALSSGNALAMNYRAAQVTDGPLCSLDRQLQGNTSTLLHSMEQLSGCDKTAAQATKLESGITSKQCWYQTQAVAHAPPGLNLLSYCTKRSDDH